MLSLPALTRRGHGGVNFPQNVIEGRAPHVVWLPDLPTFSRVATAAGRPRRAGFRIVARSHVLLVCLISSLRQCGYTLNA